MEKKSNVKYVTNEIYFDIVEQIDATFAANQSLLYCATYGEIRANCRLSGIPDLTLAFNKPHYLDDASLHRCVRINRYQNERVISFVPPDGHFKLLSYKLNDNVQIPLSVQPQITFHKSIGNIKITIVTKYTNDRPINKVVIILPLPKVTASTNLSCNVGIIKIDQKKQIARWEIGKIPNDKTPY